MRTGVKLVTTLSSGAGVAPVGYAFIRNNQSGYVLNAQGGRVLAKVA